MKDKIKIVFDRVSLAKRGDITELVKRREEMLKALGEFIRADSVEYVDDDKREKYIIKKGKKTLVLVINSTPYDGGWMNVEVK